MSKFRLLLAAMVIGLMASAGYGEANSPGDHPLWRIGKVDQSTSEFALAPGNYKDFLQHFGSPDHAYYIGTSQEKTDWPYVLPGLYDGWASSHFNAKTFNAWDQMNTLPIGFVLDQTSASGQCALVIDLCDSSPKYKPRLRVVVNGTIFECEVATGGSDASANGDLTHAKPQEVQVEFPCALLRRGYNEIALRITRGDWILFDALKLDVPDGVKLAPARDTVIRAVTAPAYAVSGEEKKSATVRIEVYRNGSPEKLRVQIGDVKQQAALEPGLQVVEIPAAASGDTDIRIRDAKGKLLDEQQLNLRTCPPVTPADYVDAFMGTAHSRWMIAPGPWMPNSMVKISPDNQVESWCAGYEYSHEYIDCFSHIHEWTMAGLGMMPTVGPLRTHPGLDGTGYSSRFDKNSEHGGIGFYDVLLKDSGIKVELTATTRASLQRYTFPASDQARVLMPLLLQNEYLMHISSAKLRRVGNDEIDGDVQTYLPSVYECTQHYDLHFVCQFSKPFDSFGGWQNLAGADVTIKRGFTYPDGEQHGWNDGKVFNDAQTLDMSGDCGAFVNFKTTAGEQIQVRTGISLVSDDDARLNLEQELAKPFGWDFAGVVQNQRKVWNDLFNRVEIETPDAREKTRFYTNMYRALCDRNIFSDVNGQWMDPDSRVEKLDDSDAVMLGSDALWNTFWNLNQVMNLVAPEWSVRWTNSELQLYDKCGWLSKGPAGLKYISVMVAEHEIPLMVAAYQAGLKGVDGEHVLAAAVKMQTTLPQKYPGGGKVGNENLAGYLKYHYVPADGPMKGSTSNTYEYSYDDWTVGQLAKALKHTDVAEEFNERSQNWRNTFDPSVGFARPRKANGQWVSPFDPFHTRGFVEGNSWQYTWFVPQDVPSLVATLGREKFVDRLNDGFEKSAPTRFNASSGHDEEYHIDQGNEPTMQVGWLFNWAGEPWLTQKWVRAILDEYYGFNPADAYLGDEDQGQMSAWFVMASMGLFQTDGGCRVDPIYEIGSPLYPKIVVHLSPKYYGGKTFTIEAHHLSPTNRYIQSAMFNGKPLNQWWIRQKDVIAGGNLVLEMGATPNKNWAKESLLPGE